MPEDEDEDEDEIIVEPEDEVDLEPSEADYDEWAAQAARRYDKEN